MRLNPFVSGRVVCCYGAIAAAADVPRPTTKSSKKSSSPRRCASSRCSTTPVSITVLNERTLQDAGRQHFEDVLAAVPNLNWAGGTSRPRFFQIRGIGEREQYEGAPNPSVGFLIDDIDFSGIGMPATLFDVGRIEVLRGPQGMRYGANALAGLIVMRGQEPADELGFATEASYRRVRERIRRRRRDRTGRSAEFLVARRRAALSQRRLSSRRIPASRRHQWIATS